MKQPIVINPAEVVAMSEAQREAERDRIEEASIRDIARRLGREGNQARVGNGCICDSGCDSCARLAEAFERMQETLRQIVEDKSPQRLNSRRLYVKARAALRLAERVKERKP